MQLGFNTNFRYRGVLFHVQTEDSGTGNPHVITHLFHGGNIMASVKQDYANLLDQPDVQGAVRKMMESMHKTMLHQLSRGEHDEAIVQRLGPDTFLVETAEAVDGSRAAEPPTTTEEELPPATILQPADIAPLPSVGSSAPAASPAPSPAAFARPPAPSPGPAASPTTAHPATSAGGSAEGGTESGSRLSKVFGDRVVSEKPLDEVVLDYLVENARKRRRQPK